MRMVSSSINNGEVANGDKCHVMSGAHQGRSGTVEDWQLSKTGHATVTIRTAEGERFKTLARHAQKVNPA